MDSDSASSINQPIEPLTRREQEILALLAGEQSNREIADQLFLSINTVKGTIQQIYNKLGVSRRREAVNQGRILGYLTPPALFPSPGNPASTGSTLPMGAPFPTETALPVGTVTFLFTDIQGSTPLWESQPERMVEALQIHNTVLRQAIETNSGVVFKTIGDAFQASFATASQALRAAIDGQKALQSAPWNELGPLKVRMGLHTGEAQLDPGGDEYAVSHAKNRVAQIMSAAQDGQILLSQATLELLRGHLPPHVVLKDLGVHLLKGLLQPEHIYQVIAPDLPVEFVALSSAPPSEPNLLSELITQAKAEHPEGNYDLLDSTIYGRELVDTERAFFLQLLAFARKLQGDKPIFEPVYQHLLYLYVLNCTRLELVKSIDRRLRGLAEGQAALILISGDSGIGKTMNLSQRTLLSPSLRNA